MSGETERYLEFVECIEISSISILSVKASREQDFSKPSRGNLFVDSKASLDSLTSKNLNALISASVKGTNEREETLFSCDLALSVNYSFLRQVAGITDDKELVERFVATNITFNAWPFIREYVAWLTTHMHVGTALLPLLKARRESPRPDET